MPTDSGPEKINLDLIQMVQQARMLHDETARPSELSAVYWIEAKRKSGSYPAPTANAGEWRIRVRVDGMDAIWERVKAATVAGELGYKSKVSTRPAAGQSNPEERLICVRTYDAADADDVERVKRALLAIGFSQVEYVADK